jgi:AmiR/NasT family two-component response regulator
LARIEHLDVALAKQARNFTEQDAFRRLQLTARERNLRLADVASRIVEQQSLLEPARKQRAAK